MAKKKRVSMKNKAAWRKHTDIKDVEEFLEDQRLEERLGKAETKSDSELFAIDTIGKLPEVLSSRQKRKENAKKPPRAWAALENTSKVQDPLVRRDGRKPKKNGRDIVSEILAVNKSSRVIQSINDRKVYSLKLREKKAAKQKIFANDLWDGKKKLDKHPEFKNDWITENLAKYHLLNIGKGVVKRPETADMKTTKAKPLELPHPGTSYNPSLKAHQELLNDVLKRESEIVKKEKHLKRVTTDMFSEVTAEERDLQILSEAVTGLPTEEEVNSNETNKEHNQSDDEVYLSVNPPVQNKKKDRKARRKQREQRLLLQERNKIKQEKKKKTDIHRLKTLAAEVLVEETKMNQVKKQRVQVKKLKKYQPRRLAKLKYEEPEIPVHLPQDLTGNLRTVKQEGNILTDRFKSLQKRNVLPPSIDVGIKKRRKIKRFVRSSHKEVPQPIGRKK